MTNNNLKADKTIFRCGSISTRSHSSHSFTNIAIFELKITYDPVCSSLIISSCTSNAPIGAALNSICISLFPRYFLLDTSILSTFSSPGFKLSLQIFLFQTQKHSYTFLTPTYSSGLVLFDSIKFTYTIIILNSYLRAF